MEVFYFICDNSKKYALLIYQIQSPSEQLDIHFKLHFFGDLYAYSIQIDSRKLEVRAVEMIVVVKVFVIVNWVNVAAFMDLVVSLS